MLRRTETATQYTFTHIHTSNSIARKHIENCLSKRRVKKEESAAATRETVPRNFCLPKRKYSLGSLAASHINMFFLPSSLFRRYRARIECRTFCVLGKISCSNEPNCLRPTTTTEEEGEKSSNNNKKLFSCLFAHLLRKPKMK